MSLAVPQSHRYVGTLLNGIACSKVVARLERHHSDKPQHFRIVEQVIVGFRDLTLRESSRHTVVDTHLGLQDSAERAGMITPGISHGRRRAPYPDTGDVSAPNPAKLRLNAGGLTSGLRIVTGRRGLVIDRQDLPLALFECRNGCDPDRFCFNWRLKQPGAGRRCAVSEALAPSSASSTAVTALRAANPG